MTGIPDSPEPGAGLGVDGFRVAITGGSSGIGLETGKLFLEAGASVVVSLDPSPVPGADRPIGLRHLPVDVSQDHSVAHAFARLGDELGALDVLVNCAGIGAQGTVTDNDDDEWLRVLNVNLLGAMRATKHAVPLLSRSASASIVNVCSIAATQGLPNRALYAATKGGLLSLTLAMAADYLASGIRVNAVNPGTARTPWVDRLLAAAEAPDRERQALAARQPMGRLVEAREVAAGIVFLAGRHSSATTGTTLAIDGGMAGLRVPQQR